MLKARVLTALLGAAVVLVTLFALPPVATLVVISAVVLLGAWEWGALATGLSRPGRWLWLAAIGGLLLWSSWLTPTPGELRLLLTIALLWWCAALLWMLLAPTRRGAVSTLLAGALSLIPMWFAVVQLRGDSPRGAAWLLFALAVVVAADTGAFFVGRAIGRVKLAPAISPGKTWEGALGGLVLSGLIAWAGSHYFGVPLSRMLPLCLAAASLSIVGDLLESLMKRHAGVKDSGQLFPGHGGVLDRVDSLSAGLPALALGFDLYGWLP